MTIATQTVRDYSKMNFNAFRGRVTPMRLYRSSLSAESILLRPTVYCGRAFFTAFRGIPQNFLRNFQKGDI